MIKLILKAIHSLFYIVSLITLTLSISVFNDSQLFAQTYSSLIVEFGYDDLLQESGIYVCRGYYFTPTQDIYLDGMYGGAWNDTNSTFKVSIYELNTNADTTSYTVQSIVASETFKATGQRTSFNLDNVKLKKDTGYLMAQGRIDGNANHLSRINSPNSAQLPHINMIKTKAFLVGTTECNIGVNSPVQASTETNLVDLGFTYNINVLNFDANATGVSSPDSISYPENTDISNEQLPSPQRTGYILDGWFDSPSGGSEITSLTSMPSGVTTYYAQWTPVNYSINFEGNSADQGTMSPQAFNYDQTKSLSSNQFSREGYTFTEWNTQADGESTSYQDTVSVSNLSATDGSTVDLYAQWTPNEYTVTLNKTGGTGGADTVQAEFDAVMPAATAPTKEGYSFRGYYDQVSGQGIQYYSSTMASIRSYTTAGISTLYADWVINQYTISFNTYSPVTRTSITTDFNEAIEAPSNPTQYGYLFDDWYIDANLTTPFAFSTMPAQNLTLHAGWELVPFEIDYLLDDGDNAQNNAYQYTVETTPFFIEPASKNGFVFDEWTILTSQGNYLTPSGIMSISPSTSGITARIHNYTLNLENSTWVDAQNYCVSTGGYLATVTSQIEWNYLLDKILQDSHPDDRFWLGAQATDKTVDGDNPTAQKWEWVNDEGPVNLTSTDGFHDWAAGEPNNSGGEHYLTTWTNQTWNDLRNDPSGGMKGYVCEQDSTIAFDGTITLQAIYIPNDYTLTFDTDGGEAIDSVIYPTEALITLPIPTRGEDFFIGWYLDSAYQTPTSISQMPPNDLTLYARWTDEFFDLNYLNILDGTNDSSNPDDFTEFTPSFNLSPASRVGYIFEGWFTDLNNTQSSITTIAFGTNETIDLYAKWTPIDYTLTFDSNGGSAVSSLIAGYETSITLPSPTRAGYRFNGWFEDGVKVNYKAVPLNNRDLQARWSPITYTLTMTNTANDETSTISAAYRSPIVVPIYRLEGYTFRGWFEGGTNVNFSSMPLGNRTIRAIMEPNVYTITFNPGEASPVAPIEAAYQSSIRLPQASLTNHTFEGWMLNGEIVTLSTMPLNGANLTAVFTPNESTITFINPHGDAPGAMTTFIGETIQLPTINKTGHTFDGWYEGDTRVTLSEMPETDKTLTARFTINQYTLNVNGFNGQRINQVTADFGEALTLPVPEQLGYLFAGWTLNGQAISGNQVRMPEGGGTVSAQFDPILYPVSWVYKDEIIQMNLPFESNIPLPSSNVTGYAFEGWQQNGNFIESVTVPLRGTTVTAIYRAYRTSQTFYLPGQTARVILTTDESFNGPTLNVPNNLVFGGYYTEPFGLGEALAPGDVIENGLDARIYPHIYNPSTAVQMPGSETLFTGTLRTSPNPHETLPPRNTLEIPWLSISLWGITLSGLVILYERGRRHG